MIKYNEGGQFHQLLAKFPDKDGAAKKILSELIKTLTKSDMFDGFTRTYEPFEEGGEKQPDEFKEMVTTVDEKLSFSLPIIAEGVDIALSREASNASGKLKARLIVDGKDYGEFDAQVLLHLEKVLRDVRNVAEHLPTVDMTHSWTNNDDERIGSLVDRDIVTYRYVEETVPVVLYEATEKHPAQVKEGKKRAQVGKFTTRNVTGRITPAQKAEIMSRIDRFLVAVNGARSEANSNVATNVTLAKEIFSDIFGIKM